MSRRTGATLMELALVIGLSAIMLLLAPLIMSHGVRALVYLPRAAAVNQAGTEILHQVFEGGLSTLQAAPVLGLRSASRARVSATALTGPLWLAEANRMGYRTADGQYVLIRLDSEQIKRHFPVNGTCPPPGPQAEEVLPYEAAGAVRILPSGTLFQYYNQAGTLLAAPACNGAQLFAVRRVQMSLIAQTGSGLINEAQTQQTMTTSLAILDP